VRIDPECISAWNRANIPALPQIPQPISSRAASGVAPCNGVGLNFQSQLFQPISGVAAIASAAHAEGRPATNRADSAMEDLAQSPGVQR